MDVLVDFSDSLLDQHRSFTHDAILIYGFIPEKTLIGEIKARFTIEDGLTSWSEWSVCSTICGKGTETRSRACSFDDALNEETLTDERSCHPEDCKFFLEIILTFNNCLKVVSIIVQKFIAEAIFLLNPQV